MNGSNRLTDPVPLVHCNFQPLRGLFCFWVINFGLGAAQEERKRKQHSANVIKIMVLIRGQRELTAKKR